jgi:hypothetical protein
MYVLAFFYVGGSVTYRVSVFYYIFAALYVARGILMTVVKINLNVVKLIY